MTPLDYIFIADSCNPRIEEMASLCEGFAPHIEIYDGSNTNNTEPLVREIGEKTDTILGKGGKIMVITNCIMGVGAKVLHVIRGSEAEHNNGTRKILMTCKSGAQVNRGLKRRGVSRIGIHHVHWDGEDPRAHQDIMRRILKSTLPLDKPCRKPWEPLRDIGLLIPANEQDAGYQKLSHAFPLPGKKSLGYIVIAGKKYLVAERDGVPHIYTQMYA